MQRGKTADQQRSALIATRESRLVLHVVLRNVDLPSSAPLIRPPPRYLMHPLTLKCESAGLVDYDDLHDNQASGGVSAKHPH